MGRFNRIVALGVPHHVTQRGNGGATSWIVMLIEQSTILVAGEFGSLRVRLIGYCLMSNHLHLVAFPLKPDGLAQALKQTHGRYASYWNVAHQSNGHVWQGRYDSCPLDQTHLWEALRYTELNPVRARLVAEAEQWPWSSAASHCGPSPDEKSLALELWSRRWTASAWREYLGAGEMESRLAVICQRTHTGRPLGTADFIQNLEKTTQRRLALQKGGPHETITTDRRQGEFTFDG